MIDLVQPTEKTNERIVDRSADKKKSPKKDKAIVVDYDDTVVGFLQALCKAHNKKYGTCVSHNDIKTWNFDDLDITDARGNRVTGADLRATFKLYEENGMYAALKPLDYAKYTLDTAHEIGYKVIIVTARNEKFRVATEYNLADQDIYCDELYFSNDKVKTIKDLAKKYQIVMFADDKASTVQDVAENCRVKNVFLITKAHNRSCEVDEEIIKRANDLMDCLKELKKVNK
ncbi:MAG TPA: hypothetical protein VI911_11385 [Patescibacteria group bacterium]|nr:hypothetical protein [Patescibacteria group bacterium]